MNLKYLLQNCFKVFALFVFTALLPSQQTLQVLNLGSSCKSVQCKEGYKCLVKFQNCSWGEKCKQRFAKCVTKKEYYETIQSCVDVECPEGNTCLLTESMCPRPPCKVFTSCARNAAAEKWLENCKQLGCTSEYDCFLRIPLECDMKSCLHTSDCMLPPESKVNKHCRGWVCPLKHECLAHEMGPCQKNDCQIFRTCRSTMLSKSEFKTLPDIEKEWLHQEEQKSKTQAGLTTPMTILDKAPGYDRTKQLFFKQIRTDSSIQGDNLDVPNRARIGLNSQKNSDYKNSTPSPLWLKALKSKTGMDVVNFWVKEAERNQHNREFHQWLDSVRETLNPDKYQTWLEDVRSKTTHSKVFQNWLPFPVPTTSYIQNLYLVHDLETKINDMEGEVLSAFPKSQLDEKGQISENKEQKNDLTTIQPEKKLSNAGASIVGVAKPPTSNNDSTNTSELAKNPAAPTFIIIQTSPQKIDSSASDPQQLNHQIHDPSLSQANPNQQFQASQPVFHNFMTPLPSYHYMPANNLQQMKSVAAFYYWLNFLNMFPAGHPIIPQLNQNLVPPNYLQNYLLSPHGRRPVLYWNHPNLGYVNLHPPQYGFNRDGTSDGDYDQKEEYFENPESNFHSRRKINLRELFARRQKNDDPDRVGSQKSRRKELSKTENTEIENDWVKQEAEIQFLKKILQGILDYKFEDKKEKIEEEEGKENSHQNQNKTTKKKAKKKEKEISEEIEIDSDDMLMETLFNMIKEQLNGGQETLSNQEIETLLEEIEIDGGNETKLLEEEFQKFLENFEGPFLKHSKEAEAGN